ncbi:MAG: hypothetical protein J7K30_11855 [Deltaproteobacteria bacterium]|nr:hypothetical protein [Deltaproteobacteria bacterium]
MSFFSYMIDGFHPTDFYYPDILKYDQEEKNPEAIRDLNWIEEEEEKPRNEKALLCRQCLLTITNRSELIEVEGAYEHTFANPQGVVFQIGCFGAAKGCGHVGPATEEWSWFKGFRWQVALCSICLTHLGWYYTSKYMNSFHGLILDRLIDSS